MRAPSFWQPGEGGLLKALLTPLSCLYWQVAKRDQAQKATKAYQPKIPVICVGNLVAGGQGKTPVVIDILDRIAARGIEVHALSRGHGGNLEGPVRIDPDLHEAERAGDEPLLIARTAPVWVAKDRALGAKMAEDHGAETIVMDDGFQNPSVTKTMSLIVIDGGFGFGNQAMIPAGPLREPLTAGLHRASATLIIGDDRWQTEALIRKAAPDLPILKAHIVPAEGADDIAGQPVIAFAGIGRPDKFYQTLESLDCKVLARHDFDDHHLYTHDDIRPILKEAAETSALAVTTAKDFIRIPIDQRQDIHTLNIALHWEDPDALEKLIEEALAHGRPHTGT